MRTDLVWPHLIILIGPPGAGKSTVGGLLAREIGCDFLDTDRVIEERLGKKISEIFVEDGESFFREVEEQVVLESLESFHGVIALGGGSILSERVRSRLEEAGSEMEVLFLDVSIAYAAPRVGFNRERPLLMVNPRAQWQELMNHRRPIYISLADRTIDTNERTPDQVVDAIIDGWRQ